jgi:molecular chaperone HtpG
MTQNEPRESHQFQAEVSRLLHLMVHSVYTEKEIFLRELISNASDACDKLRYEAIAQPDLIGPDERLAIRIRPDKAAGTLTISDNGIGMDRGELIDNLGTIARSGTRAFLERVKETPEGASLIGQFGVGFYSAFMVADHIDVTSRKAGHEAANVWHSDGAGGFTITEATAEDAARLGRGTEIVLHLKDDAKNLLETWEIERIVRTYSDHILFPVELIEPVAAEDGQAEGDKGSGGPRQVNAASALWQRSKSEVKPEEYKEVYRTVTGNFDEPALTIHYKAEGRQSYAVLLFVPEQRPFDLYDAERKGRVKLYVRRVYITDDAGLLPAYLRFVRGVVDSEDVPLNISREMLQNNPMVGQIRKAVTTRVLSEIEQAAGKDAAKFEALWEAFGPVLKEGLYEDFERREQLLKLARFRSTQGSGWRSLADYVAALRPNQTAIYYLVGESLERLKASPQLEAARARGIEVLLLTDPIDNFWTAGAPGFEGKPLKSLTHGDVDLSLVPMLEDAKPEPTADEADKGAALIARLKTALGDKVSDVVVSKRLVESAVCLVAPNQGPDRGLDRLLARQERAVGLKPVLEVNITHPLVAAISRRMGAAGDEEAADLSLLLLDEAHILDGETPADPARFTQRMNKLVLAGLGG